MMQRVESRTQTAGMSQACSCLTLLAVLLAVLLNAVALGLPEWFKGDGGVKVGLFKVCEGLGGSCSSISRNDFCNGYDSDNKVCINYTAILVGSILSFLCLGVILLFGLCSICFAGGKIFGACALLISLLSVCCAVAALAGAVRMKADLDNFFMSFYEVKFGSSFGLMAAVLALEVGIMFLSCVTLASSGTESSTTTMVSHLPPPSVVGPVPVAQQQPYPPPQYPSQSYPLQPYPSQQKAMPYSAGIFASLPPLPVNTPSQSSQGGETTKTRFCSNCGAAFTRKFCPECGALAEQEMK